MRDLNLEEILQDQGERDYIEVTVEGRVFKSLFIATIILFLVIFFQIINLGIINRSFYQERALANVSSVNILPAPRGIILDRFGFELAKNEPAFNLFLIPEEIDGGFETSETFSKLEYFFGQDAIFDALERDNFFITNELSQEQIVFFLSENVRGVKLKQGFKRVHDVPFKFAHLIGYTGLVDPISLKGNSNLFLSDRMGKDGLERYYDEYLRGVNGRELAFRDVLGNVEEKRILNQAVPGKNLKTFIDKEFQEFFYDRLEDQLKFLGRQVGVGVAMNPQNGEILALFSIPSFNSLNLEEFLNSSGNPLFSRAVKGRYLPGSTIKPLYGIAALSDGIIAPEEKLFSPGFLDVPHPTLPGVVSRHRDWAPHGWVDIYSAIARSSNVYFYIVGGGTPRISGIQPNFREKSGLGISKIIEWWRKFGVNEKTGIDIFDEKKGFYPTPEWKKEKTGDEWRIGDTYNASIGQGDILFTPIGLLSYISGIAADGKIMRPVIADSENSAILRDLRDFYPAIKEVQLGMRDTVLQDYGTAHSLSLLPFEVAAKTGTAQIGGGKTNSFFVGYAPFDEPQIAILVIVEDSLEGVPNTIPVASDALLWYYRNRLSQ